MKNKKKNQKAPEKLRSYHALVNDGAYVFSSIEGEKDHFIFMLIDTQARQTTAVDFIDTNDSKELTARILGFLEAYVPDFEWLTPISADHFRDMYFKLIVSKYTAA